MPDDGFDELNLKDDLKLVDGSSETVVPTISNLLEGAPHFESRGLNPTSKEAIPPHWSVNKKTWNLLCTTGLSRHWKAYVGFRLFFSAICAILAATGVITEAEPTFGLVLDRLSVSPAIFIFGIIVVT